MNMLLMQVKIQRLYPEDIHTDYTIQKHNHPKTNMMKSIKGSRTPCTNHDK